MNEETEIVATGLVRGIAVGKDSSRGLVSVRRGEQQRCPRCHGEDLDTAVPCPSCKVLLHAECLEIGCVSFNCRIVGTRVPGATGGRAETFDPGVWSEWERAPEGSYFSVEVRRSDVLCGPLLRNENTDWRWNRTPGVAYQDKRILQGPAPLEEYPRDRIYWSENVVYWIQTYRLLVQGDGTVIQAEVEASSDRKDEEGEWEEWILVSEETLGAAYEGELLDNVDVDVLDSHYVLEMAMEAIQEGTTFDGEAYWRAEVESRLESMDLSELADYRGIRDLETEVDFPEPFLSALQGFSPDGVGKEA